MANPSGARLAPPLRPPKVSLLTSVPLTYDADLHWANGFGWAPEGSGLTNTGVWNVCTDGALSKSTTDPIAVEQFCPFAIWAADRSSDFGFNSRDWMGRVTRKLEAAQARLIEREAYTNSLTLCTQAIALSGGNPNFVNVTPAGGALSAKASLGLLEEALGTYSVGQQCMIHCQVAEIVPWLETMAVTHVDNGDGTYHFESPMGNIVVPGRGYTGQNPGGGAATSTLVWAYATSLPQIRLGPVMTIPETPSDPEDEGAWAAVTDRTRNLTVVYAEREVSVAWEKSVHLGIQINRSLYS